MDNVFAIKLFGFIIFLIIGMIIYFIPFTQNENTNATILATSLVLVLISEVFLYKKHSHDWIAKLEEIENRPRERPAVTSILPVIDLADINPVVVRKFTI